MVGENGVLMKVGITYYIDHVEITYTSFTRPFGFTYQYRFLYAYINNTDTPDGS